MLSISNLLCNYTAGNERLRYGHKSEKEAVRAPRPVVVWAVTRACNLKCVHCYASATDQADPQELTHVEGRRLLEDLKNFGVPAVLFSGGEPLVRSDTPELIGYAQQLGLSTTLSTNGILITDGMVDRLSTLGLKYVGISIDGTREHHDKLRGMQGAFDATLAGIHRCKEHGMKVGMRFTVHALNYRQIDAIFDLSLAHGVDRLCVYHLAYAGRGANMKKVDLTSQQTRQVMDRIIDRTLQCHELGRQLEVLTVGNATDAGYIIHYLEKTNPKRAGEVRKLLQGTGGNRSGSNIAAIDPTGGVHYDQFSWHYTCGNVHEKPFSEIWTDPTDDRLKLLRDRVQHLPQACQACRFLDVCNGNLRTRAESGTGNWLGMDPGCYLTEEERQAPQPTTRQLVDSFGGMGMPFTD